MPSRAFSRFSRLTWVMLLTGGLGGALAGCDYIDSATSKADKRVNATLTEAESQMQINPASAQGDVETAVKETGASTVQQLRAKVLQADGELKLAQDLAVQVARRQAIIDGLSTQITGLANQIQVSNDRAAALKKHAPDQLQDLIKQDTANITGSDTKPDWYKTDATSLASLAADEKQAAALQQQISKLQDTIKSETDQRTKLLNDADHSNEQSEREKGQKALDLFVQGSDARKQAADLSVKLDEHNVQLSRAQADLAMLQGQHEKLAAAIKMLGDRSVTVDDRWKAVQSEIDQINAASKSILGDDSAPAYVLPTDEKADIESGTTIASKAAVIAALVQKNHQQRITAETHFNSAIDQYGQAYQLAGKFKAELAPRIASASDQKPEYDVWKEQLRDLDPATYGYLKGDAQLQKAEFYAGHAAEDKTLLDLTTNIKPILDTAQLTMPSPLVFTDLDSDMKTAQGLARDNFKLAADQFSNITEGASEPENKLAAQMQLIYTHYGWALLETAANDPQTAGSQMELARSAVSLATGSNAYLPLLPPELATAGAAAPGAPGTPAIPGTPMGAPGIPASR